jgi:hypothetical protein
MWAVLLAASVAQGQIGTPSRGVPQPVRMDPTAENGEWIHVFKEHSAVRRGTEEKILLIPELDPLSPDPPVYWGAARPDNGRLVPTELEIQSSPGLSVTSIQYPRSRKVLIETDKEPINAIAPAHPEIHLKVRADRDLPVGDHVIRARLKFQRISKVGLSEPQSLEFNILVRVVEHDAKVATDGRYYEDVTAVQKILIIMSWPVIFPWALRDR